MDASIDPGEKVKAELEVEILVLGHEIGPLRRSANRFLAGMVVKYDRFANSVRAGQRRASSRGHRMGFSRIRAPLTSGFRHAPSNQSPGIRTIPTGSPVTRDESSLTRRRLEMHHKGYHCELPDWPHCYGIFS